MPLIEIEKKNNYSYGIWKITENKEDLLHILNPNIQELKYIDRISNLKRKKQNIGARLILNKLSNKKTPIKYNKLGAPSCVDFNHISISHSHEYCIVITNKQPVGIDIQYKKSNIIEISKKFINSTELNNPKKSTQELHFIWCAKEAIYKTIDTYPISLKENIYIRPFNKKMNTTGYYKNKEEVIHYKINYKKLENYFIAIAIKTL